MASGLDSRPDLVQVEPFAFEHLVRQLFEARELETTQASRDDGVDAVAINRDPLTGGLCVIQAKRLKTTVPADAVRALVGVMPGSASQASTSPTAPALLGLPKVPPGLKSQDVQ